MSDEQIQPKAATLSFTGAFDKEHPFANEAYTQAILEAFKFPFKLYGQLSYVVIAQNPDEIDLYLGQLHVTEKDFKKISSIMRAFNKKWQTDITYCLFHSTQFPNVMLLNIRGPHASMDTENTIRYGA